MKSIKKETNYYKRYNKGEDDILRHLTAVVDENWSSSPGSLLKVNMWYKLNFFLFLSVCKLSETIEICEFRLKKNFGARFQHVVLKQY